MIRSPFGYRFASLCSASSEKTLPNLDTFLAKGSRGEHRSLGEEAEEILNGCPPEAGRFCWVRKSGALSGWGGSLKEEGL